MDFPEVPDKDKIQQDILDRALVAAKSYPPRDKPYWIQVMGIPGSGKTTFTHQLIPSLASRTPYLIDSFDSFMVQFNGYTQAPDLKTAFTQYEGPARALGFAVIQKLIEKRCDIVFEHSMSYPPARDLLYFAKEQGYQIVLVRILVPVEEAKARVKVQESVIGRHVPESLIDERAVLSDQRWEELSKIVDFKIECLNDGSLPTESVFVDTIKNVTTFVGSL